MKLAKAVLLGLASALFLRCAMAHWDSPENITTPDSVDEAKELLERARAYQLVESYDAAQKQIIDALARAPDEREFREAAAKLWREVEQAKQSHAEIASPGSKRKYLAELDEASRLSEEGKTAEAATKASQVLSATNDPELVTKAQGVLAANHPTVWGLMNAALRDALKSIFSWILTIGLALLILSIFFGVLLAVRKYRNRPKAGKQTIWRLGTIDDKTGANVADFLISAFARWRTEQPAASSGLLKLGALRLPRVAAIEPADRPEFDLSAALETLQLQIGSVNIASVAKVVVSFRRWVHALEPSITGTAFTRESQIVVHLVQRSANNSIVIVTAAAVAAAPQQAAEAASYKMYYLIARKTTVSDADLANKLREGLTQLSHYISGQNPDQLDAAYATFRGVVQEKPTYDEACLYEAIALDLLERHEEARSRFAYLADNADDPELKQKAIYNEAVSLFRKYEPSALNTAISKLDEITGEISVEALTKDPIKALAYAAKANAIAHKFIFWQAFRYEDRTKEPAEVERRKQNSSDEIAGWLTAVNTILTNLEAVDRDAKSGLPPESDDAKTKEAAVENGNKWDALTLRQLRWAMQNAKGNAHLNVANYFYSSPNLDPLAAQKRNDSLAQALAAFQECEVLLPAGVETLTNLATTLHQLTKYDQAREYARRAIKLNPNYEYAYYRLVQAWADDNRKDEAVKVLTEFPKAPQIPGFKELFNRYYIQPKSV